MMGTSGLVILVFFFSYNFGNFQGIEKKVIGVAHRTA
jgi:hypothetical protein